MENCPMTGLPCDNHKCIHITNIKDYQAENTMDLCQICGSKFMENEEDDSTRKLPQAVTDFLNILDSLLKTKLEQVFITQPGNITKAPVSNKPACPECGFTLEDIAKAARLGCAYCYAHFSDELLPVLHTAHGSIKHTGKVPKEWLKRKQAAKLPETVEDLEKQMKECLEIEDYEGAAKLRDQIRELK